MLARGWQQDEQCNTLTQKLLETLAETPADSLDSLPCNIQLGVFGHEALAKNAGRLVRLVSLQYTSRCVLAGSPSENITRLVRLVKFRISPFDNVFN